MSSSSSSSSSSTSDWNSSTSDKHGDSKKNSKVLRAKARHLILTPYALEQLSPQPVSLALTADATYGLTWDTSTYSPILIFTKLNNEQLLVEFHSGIAAAPALTASFIGAVGTTAPTNYLFFNYPTGYRPSSSNTNEVVASAPVFGIDPGYAPLTPALVYANTIGTITGVSALTYTGAISFWDVNAGGGAPAVPTLEVALYGDFSTVLYSPSGFQ